MRIPEHPIIDETSMIDPEPFKPHKVQKPQIPAVILDCSEYLNIIIFLFVYFYANCVTLNSFNFQNVENMTTMIQTSNLKTADKSLGGVLRLHKNKFK